MVDRARLRLPHGTWDDLNALTDRRTGEMFYDTSNDELVYDSNGVLANILYSPRRVEVRDLEFHTGVTSPGLNFKPGELPELEFDNLVLTKYYMVTINFHYQGVKDTVPPSPTDPDGQGVIFTISVLHNDQVVSYYNQAIKANGQLGDQSRFNLPFQVITPTVGEQKTEFAINFNRLNRPVSGTPIARVILVLEELYNIDYTYTRNTKQIS